MKELEGSNQEVLKFIKAFSRDGKCLELVKHFTESCCYWFAYILKGRFPELENQDSQLMFDVTESHFGTMIASRVYDITGDVTDDYDWVPFDSIELNDPILSDEIKEFCINIK